MEDPASFVDDDNWCGGYYELAFELGPRWAPDADAKLLRTLAAIWQDPNLDGCYRDRVEPEDQSRVEPTLLDLDEPGHLFGRATLPNGARVVCGTWVSRQAPVEGVDWVGLYLPLGALGRADERVGAFPFLGPGSSRSWREPIDQWFVDVARRVRAVTAFRVGLIGEEASALDTRWDGTVPAQRAIGYVVPTDTSLRYLPTNQWDVEI